MSSSLRTILENHGVESTRGIEDLLLSGDAENIKVALQAAQWQCYDEKEDANKYTRVEILSGSDYTGGANRTDCASAPTCTYDEEIQNFANWYTYYRSRILLARAGVGRAFARQGTSLRVGFAAINEGSQNIDGESSPCSYCSGRNPNCRAACIGNLALGW